MTPKSGNKASRARKIANNQKSLLGYSNEGFPILAAYRDPAQAAYLLFVDCPFCGLRHCHGGKGGHRVAHCFPEELAPVRGYILQEVTKGQAGGGGG